MIYRQLIDSMATIFNGIEEVLRTAPINIRLEMETIKHVSVEMTIKLHLIELSCVLWNNDYVTVAAESTE